MRRLVSMGPCGVVHWAEQDNEVINYPPPRPPHTPGTHRGTGVPFPSCRCGRIARCSHVEHEMEMYIELSDKS